MIAFYERHQSCTSKVAQGPTCLVFGVTTTSVYQGRFLAFCFIPFKNVYLCLCFCISVPPFLSQLRMSSSLLQTQTHTQTLPQSLPSISTPKPHQLLPHVPYLPGHSPPPPLFLPFENHTLSYWTTTAFSDKIMRRFRLAFPLVRRISTWVTV